MSIQTVIFSKDRPLQLDGLLQSMHRYAPRLLTHCTILWTASEKCYSDAYYILKEERPLPDYVCERNFKEDLLWILDEATPLTCFLVDDDVLYRPLPEFTLGPDEAYAPRLGRNCTYCYMADKPMAEGELDFDYPFSLDGNIYWTERLLPHLLANEYANPNDLETALLGKFTPKLVYADHSCLVGIPHNSVGSNKGNRCAGGSPQGLNAAYLWGYRINLGAMDFSNVIGVHQQIEYKLAKYEKET